MQPTKLLAADPAPRWRVDASGLPLPTRPQCVTSLTPKPLQLLVLHKCIRGLIGIQCCVQGGRRLLKSRGSSDGKANECRGAWGLASCSREAWRLKCRSVVRVVRCDIAMHGRDLKHVPSLLAQIQSTLSAACCLFSSLGQRLSPTSIAC